MLVAVVAIAASLGAKAVADALSVDVANTTAVQQAAPLARVCANDPGAAARAGADCAAAAAIVRDGVNGKDGAQGPPGRGIVGTSVSDGRLVVAYSDNTTQDVGQVIGKPGTPGAAGRGITDSSIVNGRLIVTYSDGASTDLGQVVGPAGRGIESIDGSTGRLLVTLTDGTVIDVGPLPAGPKGDKGTDGAAAPTIQSSTKTYSDGTIERCTRTGGPDTDPAFDCTRTPPTQPASDPTPDPEPTTQPGG